MNSGGPVELAFMNSTASELWRRLAPDVDRDTYFATLSAAIREHYLAEPDNPYRQSGRSSGAARWEETRRFIVQAIHRDGDFMDVGCANGLLLEPMGAPWGPAHLVSLPEPR